MSIRIKHLGVVQLGMVCALNLGFAGCQRALPPIAEPAPQSVIPLVVLNNHVLDVALYVERAEQSVRLGTVASRRTDTLQIAPSLTYLGGVRLAIDPIGSHERFPIGPIFVFPGERIELTVENYLPASSWRIVSRGIASANSAAPARPARNQP